MYNNIKVAANLKDIIDYKDQLHGCNLIFCEDTERFYMFMNNKFYAASQSLPEYPPQDNLVCRKCGSKMTPYGQIAKCENCGDVTDIDNLE